MELYFISTSLSRNDQPIIDQSTQTIRQKMSFLSAMQNAGVNHFFKNEGLGKAIVSVGFDSVGVVPKIYATERYSIGKVTGLSVMCNAMNTFFKKNKNEYIAVG